MSFESIELRPEIKQALAEMNFREPTETQSKTLSLSLNKTDLLVCAPTGSGKTAAFAIPMIESILNSPNSQGLVLAPTRELATQIKQVITQLTQFCPDFKIANIVGGADIRRQMNALAKNPQIIVATPGRLIDHIKRKTVQLAKVKNLILDEGDRMLDMGFLPQLEQIAKQLPKKKQTSLYTATLPMKVVHLANNFLVKPEQVTVGQRSMPVSSVKQSILEIESKKKYDAIIDELNARSGSVIIFVKTKKRTDFLFKSLKSYGFKVSAVHGDKTQGQRNKAIKQFREGDIRILCATDVAARGLDVPTVEHVINFDLPMQTEDYVHRIGRTARNGSKGEAISFVSQEDQRIWVAIAKKYQIPGVQLKNVNIKAPGFKKKNAFKKKNSKKKFRVSNSKTEHQMKKKKRNSIKNAPKNKKRKSSFKRR